MTMTYEEKLEAATEKAKTARALLDEVKALVWLPETVAQLEGWPVGKLFHAALDAEDGLDELVTKLNEVTNDEGTTR